MAEDNDRRKVALLIEWDKTRQRVLKGLKRLGHDIQLTCSTGSESIVKEK